MKDIDRRSVLVGSAALLAANPILKTGPALAQTSVVPGAVVREVLGGRSTKDGKIAMQLSPIAENGNSVPITLTVDEAPGQVRRIVLVATGNPFPLAAEYRF